ncbi:MAG: glycosyltransferase [Candidatus Bathyarchaeota archaeon]|nr:glycosyltransferase [Candidatus Bathyarchaeota archaeon]MDH5745736.1 glycosyltransferase [Candidatus Bathyarchaeota archaeon]
MNDRLRLVSVIISNYNGRDLLKECLNSLTKLRYPNYEVIVVDCGSTDGSPAMVRREFSNVRLVEEKRIGIGEAINLGVQLARGEIIIFDLNNDDKVDELWMTNIVKTLVSSPEIGIVCGKRFRWGSNEILDGSAGRVNLLRGTTPLIGCLEHDSKQYGVRMEVDYVTVPAVKREVFEKVGLCDPAYYFYYEDTDFCFRAKKAGFRIIYEPSAIFWHRGSSTIGKWNYRKKYFYYRNHIRFIVKNFPCLLMFFHFSRYVVLGGLMESFRALLSLLHIDKFLLYNRRLYSIVMGGTLADPWLSYKASVSAIFWNFKNLRSTVSARYKSFTKIAHAIQDKRLRFSNERFTFKLEPER